MAHRWARSWLSDTVWPRRSRVGCGALARQRPPADTRRRLSTRPTEWRSTRRPEEVVRPPRSRRRRFWHRPVPRSLWPTDSIWRWAPRSWAAQTAVRALWTIMSLPFRRRTYSVVSLRTPARQTPAGRCFFFYPIIITNAYRLF